MRKGTPGNAILWAAASWSTAIGPKLESRHLRQQHVVCCLAATYGTGASLQRRVLVLQVTNTIAMNLSHCSRPLRSHCVDEFSPADHGSACLHKTGVFSISLGRF